MRDVVEVFLDNLKCTLERFSPKPGDVFVLTIPDEISLELEDRIKSYWNKVFPENRMVIVAGGATVDIDMEVKN